MPALQNIPIGIQAAVLCVCLLGMTGLLVDVLMLIFSMVRPPDWQRISLDILSRPWTERHAVFVAAVPAGTCLLGNAAAIVAVQFGLLSDTKLPAHIVALATFLFFHLPAFLAILLLSFRLRVSSELGFGVSRRLLPRHAAYGIVFGMAALPVVWTALALCDALLNLTGVPVDLQPIVRVIAEAETYPVWMQLALAALAIGFAPVAEELLFRGIVLPAVAKSIGFVRAMLLVSLLFALLHLHLPSLLPLFLLSVLFSVAYAYSGSILVPIVMHATFNFVSVTILWLVRQQLPV
jgi:membrane protease YdiL (CAAX protease family)